MIIPSRFLGNLVKDSVRVDLIFLRKRTLFVSKILEVDLLAIQD